MMATKTVKEQYNQLPRPTFHWMKVNYLELDSIQDAPTKACEPQERHEGNVTVSFNKENGMPDLGDFQGANPDALHTVLTASDSYCHIDIGARQKGAVWLVYTVSDTMPQIRGQLKIRTPQIAI